MEQQYCVIYGCNDNDPGPFIIAVTKDQNMINGFREEHYHFCKGGEILTDGFYDNLTSDYEIQYIAGHYMTPKMITDFMSYLTSEYNQITMYADNLERDLEYILFDNDEEYAIVEEGIGFLRDHLFEVTASFHMSDRYGSDDQILNSLYANVMNIPLCLEKFLSTYQPDAGLF